MWVGYKLQMNRSSLRENGFKLKTSGKLWTGLEELIEINGGKSKDVSMEWLILETIKSWQDMLKIIPGHRILA